MGQPVPGGAQSEPHHNCGCSEPGSAGALGSEVKETKRSKRGGAWRHGYPEHWPGSLGGRQSKHSPVHKYATMLTELLWPCGMPGPVWC